MKIGQAIDHLHSNGIVLKNLDSAGILMTDVTRDMAVESAVPRICHLEEAEVMGFDEYTRGVLGDVRFRAPEVLMNKPYGFKADAWSFGVILFFLVTS
mmetsp:Transcript_35124/g.53863  ORF Transcript_35124/g.53863 Transcript_35124/m.53863 type:complete len:98 (+) Transcript_35124:1049-1342(+)